MVGKIDKDIASPDSSSTLRDQLLQNRYYLLMRNGELLTATGRTGTRPLAYFHQSICTLFCEPDTDATSLQEVINPQNLALPDSFYLYTFNTYLQLPQHYQIQEVHYSYLMHRSTKLPVDAALHGELLPLSREHCLSLLPSYFKELGSSSISNRELQKVIAAPHREFYGLLVDNQIVGMAALIRSVQALRGVSYVYTKPSHRRRGLGEALLSHLLNHVRTRYEGLFLLCRRENKQALKLYERMNF